ncbi:MAG: hypothetical protein K8I82_30245 [Anaerolineae bacterium]|nr:hypothetical protein [Anaerolineae bacterium]
MMEQDWFEMRKIRQRILDKAVWIPLRVQLRKDIGRNGFLGYKSEFYGCGSVAIPNDKRTDIQDLGWQQFGISYSHSGGFQDGEYVPAHLFKSFQDNFLGEYLVLEQIFSNGEGKEWHLNQDFVLTLGLKREGDSWLRPDEDYIEIARMIRSDDGTPTLIEARASHLKDYLCARGMALYITTYRQHIEIVEDTSYITWKDNSLLTTNKMETWEGRVTEIHEGTGMPFGAEIAVFHLSRTNIDPEEDVPEFSFSEANENIESKQWTQKVHGRKLFQISGALWKDEWIEPALQSPLVRDDEIEPTIYFIVDAAGKKENRLTLKGGIRWLWFRPEVVMDLAHRKRGGYLEWYTRDTGEVGISRNYSVHFGVNSLGLVNVFAKDIALLPDWVQKIWSGFNISPDGKVSEELLDAQMKAMPAETQAPESFLSTGLALLNKMVEEKYGISLIRPHNQSVDIVRQCHRFRAVNEEGLFALAKDINRLIAESFDTKALQTIVQPPKGENWGSLKSLEKVLATIVKPETARTLLTPLVGIYELRHADAHLPKQDIDEVFKLVGINRNVPMIFQGYELLDACVSSLYSIARVIQESGTN